MWGIPTAPAVVLARRKQQSGRTTRGYVRVRRAGRGKPAAFSHTQTAHRAHTPVSHSLPCTEAAVASRKVGANTAARGKAAAVSESSSDASSSSSDASDSGDSDSDCSSSSASSLTQAYARFNTLHTQAARHNEEAPTSTSHSDSSTTSNPSSGSGAFASGAPHDGDLADEMSSSTSGPDASQSHHDSEPEADGKDVSGSEAGVDEDVEDATASLAGQPLSTGLRATACCCLPSSPLHPSANPVQTTGLDRHSLIMIGCLIHAYYLAQQGSTHLIALRWRQPLT